MKDFLLRFSMKKTFWNKIIKWSWEERNIITNDHTIINEKVTTVIKHLKSILFVIKNLYYLRVARQIFSEAELRLEAFQKLSPGGVCQNRCS